MKSAQTETPHRYVVVVGGGRNFTNAPHLYNTLNRLHEERKFTRLVQGAARGADTYALVWAKSHYVDWESYPAKWRTHGREAGYIRTCEMLDVEKPDLAVIFPGDEGTAILAHEARKRQIEIVYG